MTAKTADDTRTRTAPMALRRASVRARTKMRLTHADQVALGKDARAAVPLESHPEFRLDESRDPLGLLLQQDRTRVPELVPIERTLPAGPKIYAGLCGWTLARAHARSGDRVALAAYLGKFAKFDAAIADFAKAYADQNGRDSAALQAAVRDGKAEATTAI